MIVRLQGLALDLPNRAEVEPKRERRARADPQLDLCQSSPEVLSTMAQACMSTLPLLSTVMPVARLPSGGLGDIGELEFVRAPVGEMNRHLGETAVPGG